MTSLQAREAESLALAAIDAALDAVVMSQEDGSIVKFNPAAERLFGLTAAKAVGRPLSALVAHDPRSAADVSSAGMVGQRRRLNGWKSDGASFPAEVAIHRVRVDGGTFHVCYVRDLTAQAEAEDALEARRQRLGRAEKMSALSSLLGGVAHELNNPLAILVAQSTVLRDKAPTPDIERRAERIHAAALRAGRIVKSFLAMAQPKAPVPESVDLNAVLDNALTFLAYGIRNAQIGIVRHFDPVLPAVHADRDLMGQVFVSLLVNAQQALSDCKGDRVIELRSACDRGMVTVDVEDNGRGIAPAIAEYIFDPYFTTRPSDSATGVGLSLCRSVLASHGGTVELRHTERGGACFRVTLPCVVADGVGDGGVGPEAEAGLSVLVVDDERDVAESLGELIELLGHRVWVETSASEALRRIAHEPFDMVFSDYHMPGLDGLAFRRCIGRLDAGLAARTVLMTGDAVSRASHGDLCHEDQALILEKPFTALNVKALLDRVTSRS